MDDITPFLNQLTELTGKISGHLWGVPAIILLVGTGLYLSIRLGLIQFRGFGHAIALTQGKYDDKNDPGEISHFKALSTALSATIGTGNIAGVATAITLGGPGAIFWMWITALVGMATKYTSCTLALKFRQIDDKGITAGGPMYTLLHGLNMPRLGTVLGTLFAIFALIASFGIGNMVQANSVVSGLSYINEDISQHKVLIGIIMATAVGVVIIGGLKRIARITSVIVPFMAIAYCLAALTILIVNIEQIPEAFTTIFELALNPWSAAGGAAGYSITAAMQAGVARGVFSNEAGLGSAAIAHAGAKTNEPVREGLVAMLGPFIDTIVICTMTALVIIIMGVWGTGNPDNFDGAALSAHAFQQGLAAFNPGLGKFGAIIVGGGLAFFAYSTMIAWSYYGDRCALFLMGEKAVLPYRIIFTCLVVVGSAIPLQLVWNLADIANILMAAPNLICLLLLASLTKRLTNDYFNRHTKK